MKAKTMFYKKMVSFAIVPLLFTFAVLIAQQRENTLQTFVENLVEHRNNMNIGIQAVSMVHDRQECAINEYRCFTPASNTKLFTALLAFEHLGTEYQFATKVVTDGIVNDEYQLEGSIYLKASGDPSLTLQHLEQLVSDLRTHRITTISGDFCIDMTEFDDDMFPPGSFIDNIGYRWNAPITACSINGKAVCLDRSHCSTLVSEEKLCATMYDLRTELYVLLAKCNIHLQGTILLKAVPENVRLLAMHQSEPLSTLVQHMLKESDNLYANCFFKKVGALYSKAPGSWDNGHDALEQLLQRIGIDPSKLIIRYGAGLSRYNLISPAHIITLLQWAYRQPYFPIFFDSLSVAGTDGTLKDRLQQLSNVIRGKTGRLSGVSALSGYAQMPDDLIAFAVLINGSVESLMLPSCKSAVEDVFCCQLCKVG